MLRLVIESLYTSREVFLRELISNASDALDKRRFRAVTDASLLTDGEVLKVRLVPDEAAGQLTIWDNGIGMTREEMASHLGTIARSGSKQFMENLRKAREEATSKEAELQLIGQFGVGFYSAFLVADRVEVVSLAAGERQAYRWVSEGKESYTLEPARRLETGTTITLHLKEDAKTFALPYTLRDLVTRYSDYLSYPIELETQASKSDEASEDTATDVETLNRGKALWQRDAASIDEAQYAEFYKHLTHDWEDPLAHKHFKVEGTQEFTGLLFVPKQPPFDLFSPEGAHGVRLHVRRVLVMEECKELVPTYLRFLRGVIDSEDLPLNVSRETLQDSKAVSVIRKQVVRQALDMLKALADKDADAYNTFWSHFGQVLKEGLHVEPGQHDRLVPLLRFHSSRTFAEDAGGKTRVSLSEYKARMPEGQKQKAIYFLLGDKLEAVHHSPHLEMLHQRGYEVLYMTDPVDSWAVSSLTQFEDVPLMSASHTDLSLEEAGDSEKAEPDDAASETGESSKGGGDFSSLIAAMRTRLQDQVSEVRVSKRLASSPACLVVPEGGLSPVTERILRAASRQDVPTGKRVMEINPEHPVIKHLQEATREGAQGPQVDEWIEVLHEQALLAEGSPLRDPVKFSRSITKLLERAAQGGVA